MEELTYKQIEELAEMQLLDDWCNQKHVNNE